MYSSSILPVRNRALPALFFVMLYSIQIARAQEKIIHSFGNGTDGVQPYGAVITDSKGNIYGTTNLGGQFNAGTVYEITPAGQETILYSFTGGADGASPAAGLVRDAQGNLYGTANGGGKSGAGTVFEVTGRSEKVLWNFTFGHDGALPTCALIRDSQGNLYGTAQAGGDFQMGVIFKVTLSGTETVLHSFQGGPSDGATPVAGLVMDSQGTLYGTTNQGGANGWGTVFKLTASGNYSVLYSFQGDADGARPKGSLILDSKRNLYGTTAEGGVVNSECSLGCGTLFEIPVTGGEKTLYAFVGPRTDGELPASNLVRDGKGNLYGTTYSGGAKHSRHYFRTHPLWLRALDLQLWGRHKRWCFSERRTYSGWQERLLRHDTCRRAIRSGDHLSHRTLETDSKHY